MSELEQGRCPYCHHIKDLRDDHMLVQHSYLGSQMCPGSLNPPLAPPLRSTDE